MRVLFRRATPRGDNRPTPNARRGDRPEEGTGQRRNWEAPWTRYRLGNARERRLVKRRLANGQRAKSLLSRAACRVSRHSTKQSGSPTTPATTTDRHQASRAPPSASCDAGSGAPSLVPSPGARGARGVRCATLRRRIQRLDMDGVGNRIERDLFRTRRWIPPAIGAGRRVRAGAHATKHYKTRALSKLITGTFEFCANSNTAPNLS